MYRLVAVYAEYFQVHVSLLPKHEFLNSGKLAVETQFLSGPNYSKPSTVARRASSSKDNQKVRDGVKVLSHKRREQGWP